MLTFWKTLLEKKKSKHTHTLGRWISEGVAYLRRPRRAQQPSIAIKSGAQHHYKTASVSLEESKLEITFESFNG